MTSYDFKTLVVNTGRTDVIEMHVINIMKHLIAQKYLPINKGNSFSELAVMPNVQELAKSI